jgi:hypothetical protein
MSRDPEGYLINLLRREAYDKKLKRRDGWVMVPHNSIPGVYVRKIEAAPWINEVLRGHEAYCASNPMKRLSEWFDTVDHPHFELLTPGKIRADVISFTNGYLDIMSMHFTTWDEFSGVKFPLTDHYFSTEFVFSESREPTPLWDNLVETQLGLPDTEENPLEVCYMFEVLVGRLFYRVGKFDNWQVMPFLKGDANTGKSTVLNLIRSMFPAGSVGVITASQEAKFGLESLYQKRLVLIPDLPRNFSKMINQADFQSMVSGEGVSVARKNKTAIADCKFVTPLLGAGNHLPDYKDNSGSVSRRMAVFLFLELVQKKDTTLEKRIVAGELVTVLVRCLTRYRRYCDDIGATEFWKAAPASMRAVQDQVKEATNHLANFLRNGDSHYQVLHNKGSVTTLQDLSKAYSNHMCFHHKIEKAVIGSDHHPIKAAGFTVHQRKLCKICHQVASKAGCGEHYNSENRYNKMVVEGMSLAKKAREY